MVSAVATPSIVRCISDLIGRTPLFELVHTSTGSRLLLKLEQFNPTGTAKIRMARQMIIDAEQRGDLRPGGHIIESTSGNTGLGLAVIAAERGYSFTAVVDGHACWDKLRAMKAMGAKLVYVTAEGDENLAVAAREELAARLAESADNTVFTEQHNNPSNALGYQSLARELTAALPGGVDYLIGAVGTGGSLCGTGRVLRQGLPRLRVIGVAPVGSITFGGPPGRYYQSGTGTPEGAEVGALVDFNLIDEGHRVSDCQAFSTARVIARRVGLLIGGSAGGVICHALTRISELPPGSTMVGLVCDGGEKYLDNVFDDDWMQRHNLLSTVLEREVDELLTKLNDS